MLTLATWPILSSMASWIVDAFNAIMAYLWEWIALALGSTLDWDTLWTKIWPLFVYIEWLDTYIPVSDSAEILLGGLAVKAGIRTFRWAFNGVW